MICEKYVIDYTGGICPISGCPSKLKYGPCKKVPEESKSCIVNSDQDCVWSEIAKMGDHAALNNLYQIHEANLCVYG